MKPCPHWKRRLRKAETNNNEVVNYLTVIINSRRARRAALSPSPANRLADVEDVQDDETGEPTTAAAKTGQAARLR